MAAQQQQIREIPHEMEGSIKPGCYIKDGAKFAGVYIICASPQLSVFGKLQHENIFATGPKPGTTAAVKLNTSGDLMHPSQFGVFLKLKDFPAPGEPNRLALKAGLEKMVQSVKSKTAFVLDAELWESDLNVGVLPVLHISRKKKINLVVLL